MNFSPYQSRGQLAAPNQNYTDPLRVSYNNRGEQALARANTEMVGVFVKGLQDMKDQYDSGKVMEANNEYNRLMTEGSAELMQRKQENALNVVDDYDKLHVKTMEKVRKKYGQFINYGKAGQAFNIYTERDNNTRRANMLKYQMAETDAYHETQFNNQLAECQNTAAQGGYSDLSIEAGMNRADGFIEERYAPYGKEMIEQQKRIFKGQIVGNALQLAVNMGDYAKMNAICDKYGKYIDPKTFATIKGMMMKRNREERELSLNQQMVQTLGLETASYDDVRQYVADNWRKYHTEGRNYKGSNAEAWKEAQWVEQQTGLPAAYIYRQWAHESAYFSSQLARENNNFGGLTQTEPNGEDNRQPDGNNYYKEYANFHEYAEDYVKSFINLYEGQENVHSLADFAHYLKDNGYYGADEADYLAAMENVEMESLGGEEDFAPSGVEFEAEVKKAWDFIQGQRNIASAENRRITGLGQREMQELMNRGVTDVAQYQEIADRYSFSNGIVNKDVQTNLEKTVSAIEKNNRKAAEQAAKGLPSEKIDADMKDYLERKIATGETYQDIVSWLADHGVTSTTELNKVAKWIDDYHGNKGAFKLPLSSIRGSIEEYQQAKGAQKVALANSIDRIAKYEYNLYLSEHDGQVPDDIELIVPEIVERVKEDYTKMYVSGDTYSWWRNLDISKADLIAKGYYPWFSRSEEAMPGADTVYKLIRLDRSGEDYKTADEIMAMRGAAGNVK